MTITYDPDALHAVADRVVGSLVGLRAQVYHWRWGWIEGEVDHGAARENALALIGTDDSPEVLMVLTYAEMDDAIIRIT